MMNRKDEVVRNKVGFDILGQFSCLPHLHNGPEEIGSLGLYSPPKEPLDTQYMEAMQHSLHFTTLVMVVKFGKKTDYYCLFYESIADLLATLLDICNLGYGTFAHI